MKKYIILFSSFWIYTACFAQTELEKRFIIKVVADKTEWVDVIQGTGVHDKVEVFGNVAEGDVIVKTGSEELKANTTIVMRLPNK